MRVFEQIEQFGHEKIVFGYEPEIGYRGIIAIHSTLLGPAVGGTRYWRYITEEDALKDALRLSRGMTYKNVMAGLQLGGGKSVILAGEKTVDRKKLFRAHGRLIESLSGRYITAEDVGTGVEDMNYIHMETTHVAGRREDPSPWTAFGVFRSMQAAAKFLWGSDDMSGKKVALQGCGNVGYKLAKQLHQAGAKLVVTDINKEAVANVEKEFGAKAVCDEEIYEVAADIFAPCALGGILNDQTIPKLKAKMVVGAANNQLLEPCHGEMLEKRGILYAPDYVVNAGGIISGGVDLLDWEREYAREKVEKLYDKLLEVLDFARSEGIPGYQAADRLVEKLLYPKSVVHIA